MAAVAWVLVGANGAGTGAGLRKAAGTPRPVVHAPEHQCVPKRITLRPPIVHHTSEKLVDGYRGQRAAVLFHDILRPVRAAHAGQRNVVVMAPAVVKPVRKQSRQGHSRDIV